MSDPVITNVELSDYRAGDNEFQEDVVTLPATKTLAKGTLLARLPSGKLGIFRKGGTQVVTVETAADGETYTVTINGTDYEITAAGSSTVASIAAQLAADLDADEDVTVVDNEDGTLTIFSVDGADFTIAVDAETAVNISLAAVGDDVPVAVASEALTSTTAGDYRCRPCVEGKVKRSKLIIDQFGDADEVDAVVKDELRDYGIFVLEIEELSVLDNQ